MAKVSPSRAALWIPIAGIALVLASAGSLLAKQDGRARVSAKKLGQTFDQIYDNASWARGPDGRGSSGSGSTVAITKEYRAYLEEFIKSHQVRSVVDAGCGDWEFSSKIDWNGARYLGIDISAKVIETVKQKYEGKNVRFKVGDVTESLPPADLLICKDVLQHLPIALIKKFIRNNLKRGKYKWAIITNDRGSENPEMEPGGYRPINLGIKPFNVKRLIDLPIRFEGEGGKITQILDLGN